MQFNFLYKFIHFRLKQIGRACKLAGWFSIVVMSLCLVGIFISIGFHLPSKTYFILPIYLLVTVPLQLTRCDHEFIQKLNYSKKIIMGSEYNLIVLPVTLILVCHIQIVIAIIGHILVSMVAIIPFKQNYSKRKLTNPLVQWIPKRLFEWRCFFRRNKFFWPICYLLAILLSVYVFVIPLGLLIFMLTIPQMYNHLETKELIYNYPATNRFLWVKLRDHSLFIHILFTPLYLLFLLLHYNQWYILVFFIISIESVICFELAYKYAQINNTTYTVHNQLPSLLFFGMILFFPAALLYIYFFWNKATKALHHYA